VDKPVRNRARPGAWRWIAVAVGVALAVLTCCKDEGRRGSPEPVWYDFQVVNTYPHDGGAFTQGLTYRDSFLYESTGLFGSSSLRKVRLETGEVVARQEVSEQYFAEGLADWEDRLIQLTWQSGVGLVYDLESLEPEHTFSYTGDGWGLTHDGTRLIMSDGTSSLRLLDPRSYEEIGRIEVLEGGKPLSGLNELEFVKGEVYANLWMTDEIVTIAPSGLVTGRADLKGLLRGGAGAAPGNLLNGIAYDRAGDRLFVTGKLWPNLFEIKLVPRT